MIRHIDDWKGMLFGISILCLVTALDASYYQDTLFPIGISGTMQTGPSWNCPYYDEGWRWSTGEKREDQLIFNLGINCIGSEDCFPNYLIDLKPDDPSENNYLHQVCMPAAANNKPVYIIVSGLFTTSYCHGQQRYYDQAETIPGMPWDAYSIVPGSPHQPYRSIDGPATKRSSSLFRSWNYDLECGGTRGFACDEFAAGKNDNPTSGAAYYGDVTWQSMMDEAIDDMEQHFTNNPDHAAYVWGWNLMTEGPASHIDININKHILTK